MKYLFLALLLSSTAHAKLKCAEGEGYAKVNIAKETGCPSGLVIVDVETSCVDEKSPAFSKLEAGKKFEICNVSVLDSTKTTYLAHVMSAEEVKASVATREEFGAAVSSLNRKPAEESFGVVTLGGKKKSRSSESTAGGAPASATAAH